MKLLGTFFLGISMLGITVISSAQSRIDTLLLERSLNLQRNIDIMNVSDADSLSIDNIYNYNYDSDKLIKKEFENIQSQIHEANKDLAEAYKTKEHLEKANKRRITILYILIFSTIIFAVLIGVLVTQFISARQKLETAQIDIRQANENFSSASEAKHQSEKVLKEELHLLDEKLKKITQQLNIEKHQNYLLQNKTRKYEEEINTLKEELTVIPAETQVNSISLEDSQKQLDEVEINIMKIERLSKLKELGNISEEEFESVKNRLLGSL